MNAVMNEGMVFCRACGRQIHSTAPSCPGCGAVQSALVPGQSDKLILPAALLCFFLGFLGAHRFYVGKIGTAIAIICTFGGFFGIWPVVDFIVIVVGSFTDKQGRKLSRWT